MIVARDAMLCTFGARCKQSSIDLPRHPCESIMYHTVRDAYKDLQITAIVLIKGFRVPAIKSFTIASNISLAIPEYKNISPKRHSSQSMQKTCRQKTQSGCKHCLNLPSKRATV